MIMWSWQFPCDSSQNKDVFVTSLYAVLIRDDVDTSNILHTIIE